MAPALLIVYRITVTPPSLELFWLVLILLALGGVGSLFAYWAMSALLLTYELNDRALIIRWGLAHQVIPLERISGVIAGAERPPPTRFSGVRWPGNAAGRAFVEGIGHVLIYATYRTPSQLLYIQTPSVSYGIAPADVHAFQEALQRRLPPPAPSDNSGPLTIRSLTRQLQTIRYAGPLKIGMLHDAVAMGVTVLALVANAALFGYVLYYYPTLPDLLPLHFNLLGEVDFIGPRGDVFRLPAIALGLFALNFTAATVLYARERLAAYIVLSTGLLVQAIFWVATTRIVY
ncbi:MAG: PH domain-containing protein [Chloroflexota bacterium]|nr:PH domain-containing protein [Dehalococcoidia bacterium]MDW8252701.1 PH domain-containing protein [Chloroflexota bacterium]